MINFSTILHPACVQVSVPASSKEDVLRAAIALLELDGRVPDSNRLLEEVRSRERLAPTGIGEGVAVPHALSDCMEETVMSVLRLEKPVNFDSLDGHPVDLVFMIAGPRSDSASHLKLLSKLARLLHDEEFRRAAREVASAEDLAQLLYSRD